MKRDADQVIGRIRTDGGWDRRYRIPVVVPEPWRPSLRDHLRDVAAILLPLAVLATWVLGIWLWIGILAAAQVPA